MEYLLSAFVIILFIANLFIGLKGLANAIDKNSGLDLVLGVFNLFVAAILLGTILQDLATIFI